MLLGSARDVFHDQVKALLQTWIDAIADVLIAAGMNEKLAHYRGEYTVIMIQGALILSQELDDPSVFQRVIQRLPEDLCQAK